MKWNVRNFRKIHDRRGNLTPIENRNDIDFDIQRVYYIYDIPSGSTRAGHAHRELEQIYISIAGSFDVILEDGNIKEKITLNRPDVGLYIGRDVWRELKNFSAGAVCLVLASRKYDEPDYIRDYKSFKEYIKNKNL